MSMTHRTDRTITSIIGLAEGLTTKLPAARDHLQRLINSIDGYPIGTDAPKVSATVELTTVEQATHQRIHLDADLRALTDELDAANLVLRNLHRDCDRILETRHETPRCNGGAGRDGAIEWGRPDCYEVPTRHGMCASCYHRERRWRKNHGLPARDDAA